MSPVSTMSPVQTSSVGVVFTSVITTELTSLCLLWQASLLKPKEVSEGGQEQ